MRLPKFFSARTLYCKPHNNQPKHLSPYLPIIKHKMFTFAKQHFDSEQLLSNSLKALNSTETRGFKILLGKPVRGQKTNSNSSTTRKLIHPLCTFKQYYFKQLIGSHVNTSIFLAEYITLFWQQQWLSEWGSVYKQLKFIPVYLRKTNYIDIESINRYHIYHFYNNPFRAKVRSANKRKKVIPKNKFATGFTFGFSKVFAAQLNNIS